MFRAVPCSSSGGQIVLLQPLVSSLSEKGRTVFLKMKINIKKTVQHRLTEFGILYNL